MEIWNRIASLAFFFDRTFRFLREVPLHWSSIFGNLESDLGYFLVGFGGRGAGELQRFQWSTECYLDTPSTHPDSCLPCVNSPEESRNFTADRPLHKSYALWQLFPLWKASQFRSKHYGENYNSAVNQMSVDEGARKEIPAPSYPGILSRAGSVSHGCALPLREYVVRGGFE